MGVRTFELDRRESVRGVRAQARTEEPQATNVTSRGILLPRDLPWKKRPFLSNPTRASVRISGVKAMDTGFDLDRYLQLSGATKPEIFNWGLPSRR